MLLNELCFRVVIDKRYHVDVERNKNAICGLLKNHMTPEF
jgi:hypothetical protein